MLGIPDVMLTCGKHIKDSRIAKARASSGLFCKLRSNSFIIPRLTLPLYSADQQQPPRTLLSPPKTCDDVTVEGREGPVELD